MTDDQRPQDPTDGPIDPTDGPVDETLAAAAAAAFERTVGSVTGAGVTRASIDARVAANSRARHQRRTAVAAAAAVFVLAAGVAVGARDGRSTRVQIAGGPSSTEPAAAVPGPCRLLAEESVESVRREVLLLVEAAVPGTDAGYSSGQARFLLGPLGAGSSLGEAGNRFRQVVEDIDAAELADIRARGGAALTPDQLAAIVGYEATLSSKAEVAAWEIGSEPIGGSVEVDAGNLDPADVWRCAGTVDPADNGGVTLTPSEDATTTATECGPARPLDRSDPDDGTCEAPTGGSADGTTSTTGAEGPAGSVAPSAEVASTHPSVERPVEGERAWALYLRVVTDEVRSDGGVTPVSSVMTSADQMAAAEVTRQAAMVLGYAPDVVDLACDDGALAALALDPERGHRAMAVYFATRDEASALLSLVAARDLVDSLDAVRVPVEVTRACPG